jgi:hypothetical protein
MSSDPDLARDILGFVVVLLIVSLIWSLLP